VHKKTGKKLLNARVNKGKFLPEGMQKGIYKLGWKGRMKKGL
jgi:hypothetical protein